MHYTGTIWRPPYEAYSLLIQVTAGCTHHSCKFCTLYEDLPFKFRMSPLSEVKSDLAEASRYYKNAPRIFFTGANPFVLTTDKLKKLAEMVKKYYPNYHTIGCFGRITDLYNKTVDDLKELRALGYDGITFGVETGNDEALAFMNKGFRSSDTIEQAKKLEKAGISYNFFYLTGISGAGRGEYGGRETAKVFNQLHPQIIESSMLTIYETSELYQEIQKGNWKEESELEKLAELKALIENLTIQTRIVTDGASNLIQVRGNLPADKEKLVKYLERLIATADESALREYRVNLKHL
ncbi:radical SAM protein [Oscillospiraceae bacterium 42-9]